MNRKAGHGSLSHPEKSKKTLPKDKENVFCLWPKQGCFLFHIPIGPYRGLSTLSHPWLSLVMSFPPSYINIPHTFPTSFYLKDGGSTFLSNT
jgi:hypothetical protein